MIEKVSFKGYETSLSELKAFCGISPEGCRVYYGPPEGDEDGAKDREECAKAGSRMSSKGSGRGFVARKDEKITEKKLKGKDFLECIMEKGLMPLAALGVIRGWMILEMSTLADDERRGIKATTHDRVGYQEVKQALPSMFEDTGKG